MEYLLTPDTGLIVWTMLMFAGLVLLLGKVAWKPLIQALEAREESIRRSVEEAQKAQQGAQSLKTQLEGELAQAQDKAAELLRQAKVDAQKLRDELVKKADEEARRLAEQTRRQLDEEKARLSRELQNDVATMSVKVAEKLMRHMMNAKEQERLAQELLRDLEKESAKN